jgi:hypothetical protein
MRSFLAAEIKKISRAGWGVREGLRGGGRNDPNIVCTYE